MCNEHLHTCQHACAQHTMPSRSFVAFVLAYTSTRYEHMPSRIVLLCACVYMCALCTSCVLCPQVEMSRSFLALNKLSEARAMALDCYSHAIVSLGPKDERVRDSLYIQWECVRRLKGRNWKGEMTALRDRAAKEGVDVSKFVVP